MSRGAEREPALYRAEERDPALYRAGVGIVLINTAGDVFVGRRSDHPGGQAAWQMPQGGIDSGEMPREAALRELAEEVGTAKAEILAESAVWHFYDLPPTIVAGIWGGRYRGQRQRWFALRFTGVDSDINIDVAHAEFDAWQWAAPDRVPQLIVPFKRPIYLAVFAEFRPFLRR